MSRRSKPPPQPRKLADWQLEFAAKAIAMRRKYPSLRMLARRWRCDEATIRRGVKVLAHSVD